MAGFKGWGALALLTAVSGCSFLTDIDVPDQEARCDDGRDDDLDGSADCSDEDCAGSSACPPPLVDVEVLVSRFLRREVFLSRVDVCVLDRPELGCEVTDDTGRVRLSLPDGLELSLVLRGTGVMPVIQPIVPSRGAIIPIQLALDFRDSLANSTFPGDPDDVAVGLVQLGPRVQCATRGWSVSFTGDATAEAVFYEAGVGDDTARRWTFTRPGAGRAYGVFDVDAADEVEARLTLEEASMGCIDPRCEGPLFPNRDWPPRGDEAARGPLRRGHVTLLASIACMAASHLEGVEESIVRGSGGGRSPAAFQPTETTLEHCGAEGGAAQGCGPLPRAREGFLNTLLAFPAEGRRDRRRDRSLGIRRWAPRCTARARTGKLRR